MARIKDLSDIQNLHPRYHKQVSEEYNALQSSELLKTGVGQGQVLKSPQNALEREIEAIRGLVIGIDTGVNTGFAVWNCRTQEFERIASMMIHEAMEFVLTIRPDLVRVEDARLSKLKAALRQEGIEKWQGVGAVKRDAKIWEDFLKSKNIRYEMVAPFNNIRKLTAGAFRARTNYTKKTNEHGRDAAMLVFGFQMRNLAHYLKGA
jgi:hypothetical protein